MYWKIGTVVHHPAEQGMYLEHYGFTEKPFNITPNPRFIFLSKNHREVFAHLLYGIRQHSGFLELTGEVGTGKTTVLRTLLGQLEQDPYRLAFIFNPSLSSLELLRGINREFGIPSGYSSTGELLEALNSFLLAENAAGRTVVLVIDEAQNLEPSVLEQVRLLSNLETEADKLIQIILVGQPELGTLLAQPGLRQLSQRITVRYHLKPMDFDDTVAYVQHRLRIAGADETVFTPPAMKKIFRFSKGVPRLINIVCDRALVVGYADGSREISAAQTEVAIKELRRNRRHRGRRRSAWALAGGGLLLAALLVWKAPLFKADPFTAFLPRDSAKDALATSARPGPPERANPQSAKPEPGRAEGVIGELASWEEGGSAAVAFNALARLWQVRPVRPGGTVAVPRELAEVAGRRGLQVERFQGRLEELIVLDVPAILEVPIPSAAEWRYLALTDIQGERARIALPGKEPDWLTREELRQLWPGRAYLLWRNHLGLGSVLSRGTSGEGVRQLQELLNSRLGAALEITGEYDAATQQAVREFQARRGLQTDGIVGSRTLMLLNRDSGRFVLPRLSADEEGVES